MIVAVSGSLLVGLGAALAGVGSVLTGIAALRSASRKEEEHDHENPPTA